MNTSSPATRSLVGCPGEGVLPLKSKISPVPRVTTTRVTTGSGHSIPANDVAPCGTGTVPSEMFPLKYSMLVSLVVTFRNTTPRPRVTAGTGVADWLSGGTIWNSALLELKGAHTFGGVNCTLELTE
jgi:hypothetical protein